MYQQKDITKITSPKLKWHVENSRHLCRYIIFTYSCKRLATKIERILRPKKSLGWNKNPGGGGGLSYHYVSEEEWKARSYKKSLDLSNPNVARTKLGQDRKRLRHEFYDKPIIQIKESGDLIRWRDVFEASDNLGIPSSQINKVLRRQFKSCANSKWVFETFTD
jgi:hypothetical protein